MSRILLVDDDDFFRSALGQNLEHLGYEVTVATNGKEGCEQYLQTVFDLVISDIRMPEMDGLSFLKFVREKGSTPFILMTGFSEVLEIQEAHRLGAQEFLAKPLKRDDLVAAIERCLKHRELGRSEEAADESQAYCKLAIDDFTTGRNILFNIFVKLSETKYIKVAHQGEDLPIERLNIYKSKGVHFLYLRQSDFRTYVGFTLSLAKAIKNNKTVPRAKKLNLLRHTGEVLLEKVPHTGVDEEFFAGSVAFVETAVDVLADDPEVFELLDILNRHTDFLYTHCVGTSLYSVMLARAVGWSLPTNKFKVALGGLLHDVGLKEVDTSILRKPRWQWTLDEVGQYEGHTVRGLEIIKEISSIPSDVYAVVKEHHEDCLAQGFPSRTKKSLIHPMARLVSVANEFCNRVIKNPHATTMTPQEAMGQMASLYSDRLDRVFLDALMTVFNFTPPSGFRRPRKAGE